MEPINERTDGEALAHPASVLALATAAHRGTSRKATTLSQAHRRSQTIVAAGDLEMGLIQKHKAVEELHSELEYKSKALEESQEETLLAARIGQTLLLRNQAMGAEIESKAIELQNRAESAEQVVKVLEHKLSLAVAQIRSLDISRTRATLEAEQLTQELDESRTRILTHTVEASRTNDELRRAQLCNSRLEDQLEASRSMIMKMEADNRNLQAELTAKNKRIEELTSTERYNIEHISRLEIENQSICQQHHVLAFRENQIRLEHEAALTKMASQVAATKDLAAKKNELENTMSTLQNEMEELRESLLLEQARVHQLTRANQELETRLDRQQRAHEQRQEEEDESSTFHLRNGSLFHELSRHLRAELHDAKVERMLLHPTSSVKSVPSPEDPAHVAGSELESPARSSTRTSRNTSSNNTDSVGESDEQTHLADKPSSRPVERTLRPPPLQFERRRSLENDAESARGASSPLVLSSGDYCDDDSLLKEFFVLTAAAVKIAGGGLRNDACNIHNEDLFEEAMAQGVTFDQFHKWLERRLGGGLETSFSPAKIAVSEIKPTRSAPSVPPPPPSRRSSIISFWSR